MARPLLLLLALLFAVPAMAAHPQPTLLDLPKPNVSRLALQHGLPATVRVRVEVDSNGCVTAAHLAPADARSPFAAAALDAARWAVFEPAVDGAGRRVAAAVTVPVPFDSMPDVEPLSPQRDRLSRGAEAAATGDSVEAVAWYVGALSMIGREPTVREPWSIRERIVNLHRGQPTAVHSGIVGTVTSARHELERSAGRDRHIQLANEIDTMLAETPWYVPLLRWRAVAAAGSDQRVEAIRWTRLYALAATEPEDRARAARGLQALGANELVLATSTLRR